MRDVQWDARSENGDVNSCSRKATGFVLYPVNIAVVFCRWIWKWEKGDVQEAEKQKYSKCWQSSSALSRSLMGENWGQCGVGWEGVKGSALGFRCCVIGGEEDNDF